MPCAIVAHVCFWNASNRCIKEQFQTTAFGVEKFVEAHFCNCLFYLYRVNLRIVQVLIRDALPVYDNQI